MPYKDPQKQKEATRKHYLANKDKFKQRLIKRRIVSKQYVDNLKSELACKECGCNNPECLDFHHTKDKKTTICNLRRGGISISTIDNEIDKCIIICANCHRKQHDSTIQTDGSNWPGFNQARVLKRQWFIEYIKQQKCCKCGENDPRCLSFHHLRDKSFTIGYMLTSGHSLQRLKEEIDKCIVVCENCHRTIHKK
jgi:ribosomal protein L30E